MSTFFFAVACAASLSMKAFDSGSSSASPGSTNTSASVISPSSSSSGFVKARLRGPAAPEHHDLPDVRLGEHVERVVGDVGLGELVAREGEHARHVGGHVAVAHHDRALGGEVELELAVVGVAVVPGHELGGGPAAGKVLARNAHAPVGLGADGVDHGVVALGEVVVREVAAEFDVAVEAELGVLGGLLVDAADRLDVRVVGGHAARTRPHGVGRRSNMSTCTQRSGCDLHFSRCPAA